VPRPLRDDEAALMADDVLQWPTACSSSTGHRSIPGRIMDSSSPSRRSGIGLARVGVKTLFIEPDSPSENGDCESFNSELGDELLNGLMFATLREAPVLVGNWRRH
jgi:putative transposase